MTYKLADFRVICVKIEIITKTLQRAEHLPISGKYIAKIMISRHAIKGFIKCLKQPVFVFCRMNNSTVFTF